jgi:dTDP-glucose 4,6-dehydratase
MKRVLITGISGLMGSNVMSHFLENTDWEIIGIASWKYKGLPERIVDDLAYESNRGRVVILTHDLKAPLTRITKGRLGPIDVIINCAADSHVDRSIADPVPFVHNNVHVALNMLELARDIIPQVFIQISTDEVYGPTDSNVPHAEWSSILHSNPYSASKACQEAIAYSYWRTYGVPVIITNTMNIFAERQDPEKYIPMTIRRVLRGETVTVHGALGNIGSRYYLHARNNTDALLFIINNLEPHRFPESECLDRYNVVGEKRLNNLEVAQMIAEFVGKPLKYQLVDFHSTRPGHDPHYGLDGAKLAKAGWVPPIPLKESLKRMVDWTLQNPEWS